MKTEKNDQAVLIAGTDFARTKLYIDLIKPKLTDYYMLKLLGSPKTLLEIIDCCCLILRSYSL